METTDSKTIDELIDNRKEELKSSKMVITPTDYWVSDYFVYYHTDILLNVLNLKTNKHSKYDMFIIKSVSTYINRNDITNIFKTRLSRIIKFYKTRKDC